MTKPLHRRLDELLERFDLDDAGLLEPAAAIVDEVKRMEGDLDTALAELRLAVRNLATVDGVSAREARIAALELAREITWSTGAAKAWVAIGDLLTIEKTGVG